MMAADVGLSGGNEYGGMIKIVRRRRLFLLQKKANTLEILYFEPGIQSLERAVPHFFG
jgi:hypothetical protein